MLEAEDLIKDIANLADFLGHDGGCKSLHEYKCNVLSCNKIALNKTFCEQHKCSVEWCDAGDEYFEYCKEHTCKYSGCVYRCMEFNKYCKSHK